VSADGPPQFRPDQLGARHDTPDMTGRVLGHEPDGPPQYSPVNDLAALCAASARRLIASAGDTLRVRSVLIALSDGLEVHGDGTRDPAAWRAAIERWLGGGMREQLAIAQQLEARERTVTALDTAFQEQRRVNGEVIAELHAENARLRAELDARDNQDANVNIIPGPREMLEKVLASPSSDWQPEEGEVVRAAADGYQVTRRGGVWVPE